MLTRSALFAGLVSLFLLPACTSDYDLDEFSDDEADFADLGKADALDGTGTYTYFYVTRDLRKCVSPLCGGYMVHRVNRAKTRCADGVQNAQCYVAEIDWSALGLPEDQIAGITGHDGLVLRGHIDSAVYGDFGNLGKFVPSEAWVPSAFAAGSPTGVFSHVIDSGLVCISYPCVSIDESKLNSDQFAYIADLDFGPSGATEDEIAKAFDALQGEQGLIVAGYRYTVKGPAGKAKGRTVTQFWRRVVAPAAPACVVTGCSGQVCAAEDTITTCEWLPEYACYATATCELQAYGSCGWTETFELETCLEGSR